MKQYLTSKNIILAVLIIGIIILLFSLFGRSKAAPDQDLYKQVIAGKDSLIEIYKDNISLHERLIEEKDKATEILQQRDSVLNAHYAESELNYKRINETLRHIPERISRIATNNDSLRILLSNY